MAWHKQLLVPRSTAIETACTVCGRKMWLPRCKLELYRRCSKECIRAHQNAAKEARRRDCETCGKSFIPRQIQITNGGGRFCSQRCNTAAREAITSPDVLALAQQRRRENHAAGLIEWKTGELHHSWKGGKDASKKRRMPKQVAWTREYRRKNPERVREWKKRRGGGKVLPRLPWGTIPRLGEAQRWKCAICRCGVRRGYHVDHIQPISKGGLHEPRNLQLLCATCNVRKNAKDPIAYMQELGRLL